MKKGKVLMEVPYFQVPNEIFDVNLSPGEIAVYCYLARCGNGGGQAFPSYANIAGRCGMTRKTAIDTVAKLIDKGLVKKTLRSRVIKEEEDNLDKKKNYSNVYRVVHVIPVENILEQHRVEQEKKREEKRQREKDRLAGEHMITAVESTGVKVDKTPTLTEEVGKEIARAREQEKFVYPFLSGEKIYG